MNELKQGQRFKDFDEFTAAVNAYGFATNAVFTTLDSKRTGIHQYIKLACKHYGNPRSKSKGIRPLQKSFKQNCPVFVYAKRMEGCVSITRLVLKHENHECDPSKVYHYPERRQLDKYEKQVVETLVSDNIGPSVIRNKVRKLTGKPINAQDMVNLRYKLQEESLCEVEELIGVLVELLNSDQDAVVILGIRPAEAKNFQAKNLRSGSKTAEVCPRHVLLIDLRSAIAMDRISHEQLLQSENILTCVFIQLGTMRRTFAKYPQVLLMNNSYNITENCIPLTICMALDSYGSGRVIAYMFDDSEAACTTKLMLNCLKQASPSVLEKVTTVVLDKDPNERAAVVGVLGDNVIVEMNSSLALHAMKELALCIDNEHVKKATCKLLESLVYARSEGEYDAVKKNLLEVAPEHFSQYFLAIWDTIRETWVLYEKFYLPNSDHSAWNESRHLKDAFTSSCSLAESIRSIWLCHEDHDSLAFERYESPAKLEGIPDPDPDVAKIMSACTPFAAKLLTAEILAMEGLLKFTPSGESCECAFYKSLHLPCRHILLERENKGEKIRLEDIPERWLKSYQEESRKRSVPTDTASTSSSTSSSTSAAAVYSEAMDVCKDICRILSERDDAEFEAGLQTLKELRDHWLAGNDVVMAQVSMSSTEPAAVRSTEASVPSQPSALAAPSALGGLSLGVAGRANSSSPAPGKRTDAHSSEAFRKPPTKTLQAVIESWADYHVRFLDAYAKHGLKFWSVSTGNEPINGIVPILRFNSLGWTPSRQSAWIRNNLGPAIRNSVHNRTKIIALDDQRLLMYYWLDWLLDDKETQKYVDGVGIHWYVDAFMGTGILESTHKKYPDKFLLYTEACVGSQPWETHGPVLGSWDRAETLAADVITVLNNWVTGWIDWNLALDLGGGPNWAKNFVDSPIVVNATAGEFYKQPLFYAHGHFSKFIPRRSVRIAAEASFQSSSETYGDDKVAKTLVPLTTAFQRPDGTIAVVLFNKFNMPMEVELVDDERGAALLDIPPRSISTVLYS